MSDTHVSLAGEATVASCTSAKVPCSAGGQLTFSWGLGTELRLCEVMSPTTGQGGFEPFKSVVIWSAPSTSHKALAHAVMAAQDGLLQAHSQDSSIDAIAPELLTFTRNVREALAKERDGAEGSLIALEHAIWQLLEVFFIDATRSGGFITEDLSAWLAEHGAIVDEMMGRTSLQSRLDALLASARPDVLEDYWPCLSHLVAVGRVKDALRLMDAHDVMQGHVGVMHSSMMPQYELLDALYVLLRQMPRFRRGAGVAAGGSGSTGREFDNMAEFLHYRGQWQLQCRKLPLQCEELFQGCTSVNARTAAGPGAVSHLPLLPKALIAFVRHDSVVSLCVPIALFVRSSIHIEHEGGLTTDKSRQLTSQGVRSALAVMAGDNEATLAFHARSWLELLVAELTHMRPNVQARHHLCPLMRHCQDVLPADQPSGCEQPEEGSSTGGGGGTILPLLNDLMEAMVDLEVQRVVEVLSSSGAVSPWFMAHMYEVMRATQRTAALIERPLPLFGGDQVEYWRLLFAEMLACQPSTAKLALSYLALCPTYGAEAAETLLESLPLGEDSLIGPGQVHRLLYACESLDLASSATVICRAAAGVAWYQGRIGEAAAWAVRARDERRLAIILEPAVSEMGALLTSGIGCYKATMLALECSPDLESLVRFLSSSSSSSSGSDGDILPRPGLAQRAVARAAHLPALNSSRQPPSSTEGPAVQLLRGFLRLQQAVRSLLSWQATSNEEEALAVHHAVRDALMGLLLGRCLPRSLALPLLFYAVPFLEARVLAFSVKDVESMIRVVADIRVAYNKSAVLSTVHVRHVKDVQLALSRALARSHVCAEGLS